MRTHDQAYAAAADEPAFSNGTEGEEWMENWCQRCTNDSPELVNKGQGCPLILIALIGRTPSEWIEQDKGGLGDRYHCVEFRDRDEPGDSPEPDPVPQCDGQLDIVDAYLDTAIAELTPAREQVAS